MTSTFVDAWQVQSYDQEKCTGEQNDGLEMDCNDDIKTEAEQICEKILSNDKFSDCMKVC